MFNTNDSNSIKSFIWPKETCIDLGSENGSFIDKSAFKENT